MPRKRKKKRKVEFHEMCHACTKKGETNCAICYRLMCHGHTAIKDGREVCFGCLFGWRIVDDKET